jgi:hypothetical protein
VQRIGIFVDEENREKNRPGNEAEQNVGIFSDETGLALIRNFNK